MAIRKLTYALAAAGMMIGTTAHAAAVPARQSAPIDQADQLSGDTGMIAVVVGILAILAIIVFDNDDSPSSP